MESQQNDSRIKACKVCFTPYDIKDRRPRVLFCGHTFCSSCVTENIKGKKVVCPNCRIVHQGTSSSDFPINYELENYLQEDPTSGQLGSEDNSIPFCDDVSRGISKKLRSMRQELSTSIEGLRTKCHEACSQLHQYKSQLMEWKEQHHKHLESYRGIVHQHEDIITCINKECSRVDEAIGMGNEEGQKMKIAGDNLALASTSHDILPAFEEVDLCYDVLDTWTHTVHKHFPDTKLIAQSKKLRERSKSGLLKCSVTLDKEGSVPTAQVLATSQCQGMTSPLGEKVVSQDNMTEDKGSVVSLEIKEKLQKTLDSIPPDQTDQTVQTHTTTALEAHGFASVDRSVVGPAVGRLSVRRSVDLLAFDRTPPSVFIGFGRNLGSRPGPGRRPHQPRPPGVGQVSRSGQGKVIGIPMLSTGREPKLKSTENAWKPSVSHDTASLADEQAATDEVVNRMRHILNRLTPEKFEKLVGTVQQMPIDTTERLSALVDLIYEKAVDDEGFSSTYASLSQVLSTMSVRGEGADERKSEVKFRNLIINKCQKEFEKDNMEEIKSIRMKEIETCPDPEKKAELKAKWDFDETKLKQRSVGNIRFIGELYKLRMLTSPIMMRIISRLLQKRDEESLECLCKLLTTIGKILEAQCSQQPKPMEEFDKQFRSMHRIAGDQTTNSRARNLIIDVVDLRRNNWIPRRKYNQPKTKAQVYEEVKRQEIEQQIALASTPNRRA